MLTPPRLGPDDAFLVPAVGEFAHLHRVAGVLRRDVPATAGALTASANYRSLLAMSISLAPVQTRSGGPERDHA